MSDPFAEIAPPPQPNEEIEKLKSQICIQQMHLNSVSEAFLRREEEMLKRIISLQDQLSRALKTVPPPESIQMGPTKFEDIQGGK